MQASTIIAPTELIGHFKTFGYFGPVYEVLSLLDSYAIEPMLHIRIIETGEETDYPVRQAIEDPEA